MYWKTNNRFKYYKFSPTYYYVRGGVKCKKEKTTTKKVKKKHVDKKGKLRILKCYKVDGEKL